MSELRLAESTTYELEFDEQFDGGALDERRWLPYYLPHWGGWERTAARYVVGDGCLRLRIEADQEPWCPELDGPLRVSSLQTGLFAGPVGSGAGQLRFRPEVVVRDGPHDVRLYTPWYGRFEVRAKAIDDPRCMVAFWMIGFGDAPERSGEILICEIFGKDVGPDRAAVGMGVRPWGDPRLVDEFSKESVAIDAREFHVYRADWEPDGVAFFVDDRLVKRVGQSPDYPMQLLLNIYEFADEPNGGPRDDAYPKEFIVDWVRGYRYVE
jgi:hypothetical protein